MVYSLRLAVAPAECKDLWPLLMTSALHSICPLLTSARSRSNPMTTDADDALIGLSIHTLLRLASCGPVAPGNLALSR